tara:strand:- start:1699 stop:2370 length:672 start_codon:yes stop_codon:yes gene_type:complete
MNYNAIENALTVEEIDNIHSFLSIDSPSNWWAYVSSYTSSDGFSMNDEVPQIQPTNKGKRDVMQINAFNSFKAGRPGYSYSRQMGNYPDKWSYHIEGCNCFICESQLNGIFKPGGKFEDLTSSIAGKPLIIETLEWMRYGSGDFYGHRRLQNHQYGFCISATKEWNPLWGGNLVGWKANNEFFTLPQDYNTLCLWDGTTAVTPVIPSLFQDLYVLSGTLVTKA